MKCCSLLLLLCLALNGSAQHVRLSKGDMDAMAHNFSGVFSALRPEADGRQEAFIFLHIDPVYQNSGDNSHWFYAEWADSKALNAPFKQVVYRFYQADSRTIACEQYELINPAVYTGAWRDKNLLAVLTPASLTLRQGCTMNLYMNKSGSIEGMWPNGNCNTFSNNGYNTNITGISIAANGLLFTATPESQAGPQQDTAAGFRFSRVYN